VHIFQISLPFAGCELSALTLIAIGFAVGVMAGFFGVGGGWILTPALNMIGFHIWHAIGTDFGNITCQSAVAVVKHRRMGNVDYVLGATVGVLMMLGVEAGKRTVEWLKGLGLAGGVVRWVYIVFLLSLGGVMVWDALRAARRRGDGPGEAASGGGLLRRFRVPPVLTLPSCGVRVSLWTLVGLGLGIGFLAGMMGVGGGFALVPAFIYLVGTPTLVAVGTSLVCILLSAAYGTFTYALSGYVEPVAVIWLVVGSLVGTQFGTAAVRHVRGRVLRLLYGLLMMLAAGGVLLKQFGQDRAAAWLTLGAALAMSALIIGWMAVAVSVRHRAGGT